MKKILSVAQVLFFALATELLYMVVAFASVLARHTRFTVGADSCAHDIMCAAFDTPCIAKLRPLAPVTT